MDRRAPLPAGAELLHPAARPRGAAARDLYRLADAQDQGRAVRRHAVRAARPDRHHGAELDLRAARQGHDRAGPVLRPEGRRAGDRGRGGAAGRQARAQEQRHARRWRRRPSSRSSSTTCRSRIVILAPASSATVGGRAGWQPFLAGGGHGKVGDKQVADAESLLGEETPEHARPNLRWSLVHHRGVPGAVAGAGGGALSRPGRRQRLHQDRASSSARWPSSPSAAPMPCWPTSPSRRSTTITG